MTLKEMMDDFDNRPLAYLSVTNMRLLFDEIKRISVEGYKKGLLKAVEVVKEMMILETAHENYPKNRDLGYVAGFEYDIGIMSEKITAKLEALIKEIKC